MMNQETRKPKLAATICMGLALFATQFGAGNLIFPPFLGRNTGTGWFIGFLGFFLMDVGLAAAAVLSVVANRQGTVDGVVGKLGKKAGKVLLTVIILCLGPCVCIPRTAATTYEMGVHTLLPGLPQWVFGLFFFSVTLLFVIRPAKVVDIIGNYLTPILLAVMVLLIVVGIVHPVGDIAQAADTVPFKSGILNGYQTLDGIGGVLMTMMLITAAQGYGYKKQSDLTFMVAGADLISAVLLALVYGGLTLLGATTSGLEAYAGLDQAPLLISLTGQILGRYGVLALTVIVLMACLTTAVGLSSVAGNYFEELTGGRLEYKKIVTTIIVISFVMSNIGLTNIIRFAVPVLSVLYPPLIVLVVAAFFDRIILNDHIGGLAAYFALAESILEIVSNTTGSLNWIHALPLSQYGLGWILPAVLGAVIGAFWKSSLSVQDLEEQIVQNLQDGIPENTVEILN